MLAADYPVPVTVIKLSGRLARLFGRKHRRYLDSGSVNEVFSALRATIPGFTEAIKHLDRLGMRFAIFRNRKNVSEDELNTGGTAEVRIVPVVSGCKRAGVLQTVIGIVLIAVAWWNPAAWYAAGAMASGIGLAAGGVIQMLSPQLSGTKQSASPENMPSYAFGSAKNTTASGNPVPICIGERRWGGAIISAAIYAEDKA